MMLIVVGCAVRDVVTICSKNTKILLSKRSGLMREKILDVVADHPIVTNISVPTGSSEARHY